MAWETRPAGPQAEAARSNANTKPRTRRDLVLAQAAEDEADVDERADGTVIEKRPRKSKKSPPGPVKA